MDRLDFADRPEVRDVQLLHLRRHDQHHRRAATSATRPSSGSSMRAARCSTSTTSTAARTAGASTRRPTPPTTMRRPAWTSARSWCRRSRPRSTRRRSGRASPTRSRSRTAPVAHSRVPASSCSTATSATTTSRGCGASGGCTTRCSLTSCRCRIATLCRRPSTRPRWSARTINGQKITKQKLDAWIRPQLPPQGVTKVVNAATRDTADQDASVWDWTVDSAEWPLPRRTRSQLHGPVRPAQGQAMAELCPGRPRSPGRPRQSTSRRRACTS